MYGAIEKISTKIRRRFLKFAGPCLCRDDEVVSDLVIWEPNHVIIRRGRPQEGTSGIWSAKLVYEMRVDMMNRNVWRTFTVRETTTPK